jgi:phosphoribosylanthranilate isomerase
MLLLDTHRSGDVQIGALGVTHSWELDREIVARVRIPVIIAGGLGPDNVAEAIRIVRPAGVDSKNPDGQGRRKPHERPGEGAPICGAREAAQ